MTLTDRETSRAQAMLNTCATKLADLALTGDTTSHDFNIAVKLYADAKRELAELQAS